MLHALQEAYGHVPAEAHAPICAALNITRAELHGVISFYHDFRDAPAGRHVLKICRSEACRRSARTLSERVLNMLGVGWGETTPDGRVTVEPVYCLGLCACGPAAMVDGAVRGRVERRGAGGGGRGMKIYVPRDAPPRRWAPRMLCVRCGPRPRRAGLTSRSCATARAA
jgi:formate dehydrogenase subunit gamma